MLTPEEKKVVAGISFAVTARMLGIFLLLPVLSPYVSKLEGSTPLLTGLAVGIYGLTQALLQIPLGYLSDKVGRKPVIIGGFFVYILGSVLGGIASNVWTMIVARLIQGGGAVSSAAISLVADLIREEVRSRAFAKIGASISLTFAVSIVAAPAIAGRFGVPFIFFLTALLSALALLYIALLVKEPKKHTETIGNGYSFLLKGEVIFINLSVFLLHALLVSVFTVVPVELINVYGLQKAEHWKLYLPVILLSVLIMVPAVAWAEKRGRTKGLVLAGVFLVSSSFLSHLFVNNMVGVFLMLLLFFVGFHLLEPTLPSALTKVSGRHARGLSVGVYNTSQFVGAFAGGVLGGVFLKSGSMVLGNFLISLLWLFCTLLFLPKVRF